MISRTILDIAIAAASLIGFVSTALLWYRTRIEKSYAAQREFQHLKKAVETLSANVIELLKHQEEETEKIKEAQRMILNKLYILAVAITPHKVVNPIDGDDIPTGPL